MDKKQIDELIEQYVPFDEPIPYITKAKERIYIYPVLLKNIKELLPNVYICNLDGIVIK